MRLQRRVYEVITIASGFWPTLIGLPALPVAVTTGMTVPAVLLTMQMVLPFGVIAAATGSWPARRGRAPESPARVLPGLQQKPHQRRSDRQPPADSTSRSQAQV